MKCIRKILKLIGNIILIIMTIAIAVILYNLVQIKFLKHEYCNFFGYTVFQVATGSMAESIEIGDIVFVDLTDKAININDIIVFKQDDYIITHRIVEIDGNNLITKGDANNTIDKPITIQNVIGKVVKIIPNVAIWEKVFTTPKVFILLIVTVTLFIFIVSSNDKDIDNENNEKQHGGKDDQKKESL